MGLENRDTMVTRAQINVPVDSYMSIGSNTLKLEKVSTGNYTLSYINTVWKDQTAREAGVSPFKREGYSVAVVERSLGTSLYTTAYTHLKTIYTNTVDV